MNKYLAYIFGFNHIENGPNFEISRIKTPKVGTSSCALRTNFLEELGKKEYLTMCPEIDNFLSDSCYTFSSSAMNHWFFKTESSSQEEFTKYCKSGLCMLSFLAPQNHFISFGKKFFNSNFQ